MILTQGPIPGSWSVFLKKLIDFFDQTMLHLFEFERFLDLMISSDREALQAAGRKSRRDRREGTQAG
jgi:hypothetical protein